MSQFLSILYNENNYNGETAWSLNTWIKKHKSRDTSAVFELEDCQATGHNIKPHNVKVLSDENNTIKHRVNSRRPRLLKRKPSQNRDEGLDLPAICNPLLGIRNVSVTQR